VAREDYPDDEQLQALRVLSHRAALALQDRQTQTQVFESLENLAPQVDLIQRLRAAGRYNENTLLTAEDPLPTQNVSQWVREALTHYWGGPKLTESPLMRFKIVQSALEEHEGNYPNALRAILRQAIEKTRPEGERRFTGEWILYNILEMKFLEGRKVREIATRLAMSEADLYRKQRIAIEEVAKAILDMETRARNGSEG
jgi:ribosomal protein S7